MEKQVYENCFICGKDNPVGLKLIFQYGENSAFTKIKLSRNYEGYPSVIHGGIVAALLDEVMAKAILNKGVEAVTVEINLKYKSPLEVEKEYFLSSKIIKMKSKIVLCEASIVSLDGKLVAEADGKFFIVNLESLKNKE